MRSSIALVQAGAGDVPAALRTADTISSVSGQKDAYGSVTNLLTAKGAFDSAKQVILAMKEDWLAVEIKDSVLRLTKAEAKDGVAGAIDWARRQKNMFAEAQALLGWPGSYGPTRCSRHEDSSGNTLSITDAILFRTFVSSNSKTEEKGVRNH